MSEPDNRTVARRTLIVIGLVLATWSKAMLFGDTDIADQILTASHPHRAKTLGRQVRGFDQAVWEARRYAVVVAASIAKFGQHADLGSYLLGTGDRILVEASPVDRIWGIGLASDDPRAADPAQWQGLNLLGFALMHARDQLQRTSNDRHGVCAERR